MAVGKNKRLSKGKKGLKKKVVDAFARKEWYDIKAPVMFTKRNVGKTLVNRTQGLKISSDSLKGRVFDISLADLNEDAEEQAFRKILLKCHEVSGKNLLTNFHGMHMTSDKLRSLVKKRRSTIEAFTDVKTSDGYLLRIFVIGFTKPAPDQIKKTCYAQTSQIRMIRKKMFDIVSREVTTVDLKDAVKKFVAETIGRSIEKECLTIFPLENVFVRKVKILKAPKFDLGRLLDLHGGSASAAAATHTHQGSVGTKIHSEWKEPAILDSV